MSVLSAKPVRDGLCRWWEYRAKWSLCAAAVMFVIWFNWIGPGWAVVITTYFVALDIVIWGLPAQARARATPVLLVCGVIAVLLGVSRL